MAKACAKKVMALGMANGVRRGRKMRDFRNSCRHAIKALAEKAEAALAEADSGIGEWKIEFLRGRMDEAVREAESSYEWQCRAFRDMDAFLAHWLGKDAEAEIAEKGKAIASADLYWDVRNIWDKARMELLLIPMVLKGKVKVEGDAPLWKMNWHFLVENAMRKPEDI